MKSHCPCPYHRLPSDEFIIASFHLKEDRLEKEKQTLQKAGTRSPHNLGAPKKGNREGEKATMIQSCFSESCSTSDRHYHTSPLSSTPRNFLYALFLRRVAQHLSATSGTMKGQF